MATIKVEEINNPQQSEGPPATYICGVDFAEHGSGDISVYCVMKLGADGLIVIEEMTKVPPFSQFAMERLKEIEKLQTEIFLKYPGIKFLKQSNHNGQERKKIQEKT